MDTNTNPTNPGPVKTDRDATHQRHEQLLHAVNSAAVVLLAAADDENLQASLLEGMEIIGCCVDVDRIHIWRSETVDGASCYVNQAHWLSEYGKRHPAAAIRAYSEIPEWEEKFARNEYVNGPLTGLSANEQKILGRQDVKSILAIPLFMQGSFYGFFSFKDCRHERVFSVQEVEILRSAGMMIVSALNRVHQAAQLREAHERTRVLLDSMPLCTMLWNADLKLIDCNDENIKLFKAKDKQDFFDSFYSLAPEYQPDGRLSSETALWYVKRTFEEGECVIEWMHRAKDGALLPVEITLTRVRFGGNDYVSVYLRDLREYKQMIGEIEQRDKLLNTVIANYSGIIWCVDRGGMVTLFKGRYLSELGLNSEAVEGKKLSDALPDDRFAGIRASVQKTFTDGPLDFNTEMGDRTYRIRTSPIYDKNGDIASVVGNFDDITERTRLQHELKAALKEAQEANNAKSSFLASMSHEMRTPLNAVIGLSELTLEAGGLSVDAYTNLEKINSAGITLLNTVNDILDISKIEAGKFELVSVECDIPSIINDAITQSIMRIGSKPIRFILDIDENIPARLYGDDIRIKQMLNNLLSNAFKYTKEGTVELRIYCERVDASNVRMIAQVKDTGVGIRKEDMEKLFNDYTQMDTKSNRKIEGTGLGLPITKRIAEMMGGSISVESEYGKGSIFTVAIMQQFVTDAIIGTDVVESLKNFHYSNDKRRRNSSMMRIAMPYARVLVVDDVTTNLDVARGMMKPYGMQIDCATGGREAVKIVREGKVRYNAIFMDHMMPDMDGIEATRIIREEIGSEYAKTVPIIALTANAIIGNEEMFLSKGFQAFLPKPIEIARLDAILRQWVRDRNQEEKFSAAPANGDQPAAEAQGLSARIKIDGINTQKGLERFGGDAESFMGVLRSYAINTPPLLERISEVSREGLADYAVLVHGIKGASQGICAEQVGTMAEALERAAKAGDFSFVKAYNPPLIISVKKLVTDISDALGKMAADNPKPQREKPDREALSKLLNACAQYKMDDVDEAMAELEAYEYKTGSDQVQWLRENVDNMNFAEIREKLSI